jgi:ABC-type spermidine/putrescine transport system permease subunit I
MRKFMGLLMLLAIVTSCDDRLEVKPTQSIDQNQALVFILAVGFYVTPALVGGPSDQMISYFIAYYTNESLNWNAAAALSVALLAFTALLFAAFARLAGLDRLTVR